MMRTPNLIVLFSIVLLLSVLVFTGCSDDDGPTSPDLSWEIVFEDNFDGDELNTTNWTQFSESPPPYSLTGSGELEIEGEAGSNDGALFLYTTAITGSSVRVTTKFRVTLGDPIHDDVDMGIVLNLSSASDSLYYLSCTSDPFEATRDYELKIVRITGSATTIIMAESMGGTMPQITADNSYILEGTNNNGTITFAIKNEDGVVLKSISVNDSSYSGGRIGVDGDCNIGTTGPQSVFFDYVRVEKYQ